ncbi:helix-turn-helix domain-containing protein [Leptolyngbya sp. AN02str]|uniref:helix-turn-helix domain-containing protein n=1 Tax=Leptolyngbya sp. AN02str TaxID=3423363 RepID=UPI003D31985A
MSPKLYFRIARREKRNLENCIPLAQYAKQQHISETTVRNWIASKKLVAYKCAGHWYVDPESLYREPLYW